ncbi:dipeptidyl aminopeptidase/acylaminoacyl peptidase [Moesziomyces antarcticus]|uniref:Dipeptidyl-peptidase V n=1 Tax=Pseudozyma antarctica TaxID=84753 RepID=A0A5C3FKN2_PSEA2|nr:dipeptidyl aminopeptidase/acylaminoacyl peptidase [Moesziomyces antarcticus]GAK63396.1 dipeptidyl aminopeptidase/acylaminoacyl peptidase [Moesziomyces antarcticus]SPO43979.1 uncharacterized protein PSANT_01664 [Moesziomyces antarcticus]
MTSSQPSKAASKTVAKYGFWESPITTDLLLQKATGLQEVLVPANAEGGQDVAWVELRMSEAGRYALMHTSTLSSDDAVEVSAGKYNARSSVHEYGGGAAASLADGSFIFSDYNHKSFDVLRAAQGEEPKVITPENAAIRYADFGAHPSDKDLCLAIEEDHTDDTPSTVVNSIVLLDMSSTPAKVHTLLEGKKAEEETERDGPQRRDFYTFARFSPNGKYVCWVSWNHPSMPWWDTQLWVARLDRADPAKPRLVSPTQIKVPAAAGAGAKQQVLQNPVWGIPANPADDAARLFFTCDATGFLNLYSTSVSSRSEAALVVASPEAVLPEPVKHDFSAPCWTSNNSDYVALSPDMLVVTYTEGAKDRLGLINLRRPRLIPLTTPYVSCSQLRRLTATSFVLLATQPDEPTALVRIDLRGLAAGGYVVQPANITVVKRSSNLVAEGKVDRAYLSAAREIEFPTTLPDGKPATAHALVFEPKNRDYVAPEGTVPPCVFTIHGGPSSSAGMGFNLATQFWTSRGFMVCAVNYGGSTGYGREYLERLTGEWGVTDVVDCVAAAKFLGSSASVGDKSFAQLTAKQQDEVRRLIEGEADEAGAVTVEEGAGGCKVTLRNTRAAWGWGDIVLGGASVGLAVVAATYLPAWLQRWSHCIPSVLRAGTVAGRRVLTAGAATMAVLPYVASKAARVCVETVAVIPGLGVQLSIQRALSLFGRKVLCRTSSRLVPQDTVMDVYVAEGMRYFSVVDYLALVTRVGTGARIEPLFSGIQPRLGVVQRIYRALQRHLPTRSTGKAKQGSMADPASMLISGGSAGGYTVLAALCLHPTVFAGGVSRYGVSSLTLLAQESHKFESQYPFQLIGGTPEQVPDVYHDRSPLFMAHKIKAPILILQGTEDKVVPKSQADQLVDRLKAAGRKQGTDWKYVLYEGEGHGFRDAKNIKDATQQELHWWQNNCL